MATRRGQSPLRTQARQVGLQLAGSGTVAAEQESGFFLESGSYRGKHITASSCFCMSVLLCCLPVCGRRTDGNAPSRF